MYIYLYIYLPLHIITYRMGRRSKVRGVAMNPVDHPNGGGEGKKSGKGLSPWGKHSKGFKTVRKVRSFIKLPRWKAKKIVG